MSRVRKLSLSHLTLGIKNRSYCFFSSRIGTLPPLLSSARPARRRRRPRAHRPAPARGQKGSGKPRVAPGDPNPTGATRSRPLFRHRQEAATTRAPCRSPARPGPLGGAVQTRCGRPPPPRLSGSSAAPQCGIRDGAAPSRPRLPLPAGAMGWEEKQVRGYGEFVQTAQRYHGRPIFALFCGDKDAEGRSWCPDCVTGEARGGAEAPPGTPAASSRPAWRRRKALSLV